MSSEVAPSARPVCGPAAPGLVPQRDGRRASSRGGEFPCSVWCASDEGAGARSAGTQACSPRASAGPWDPGTRDRAGGKAAGYQRVGCHLAPVARVCLGWANPAEQLGRAAGSGSSGHQSLALGAQELRHPGEDVLQGLGGHRR